MNENITSSGKNTPTILGAIKMVFRQYKSDIKWVRDNSRWYKQKPYHPIKTRIAIFKHLVYWMIIKRK